MQLLRYFYNSCEETFTQFALYKQGQILAFVDLNVLERDIPTYMLYKKPWLDDGTG